MDANNPPNFNRNYPLAGERIGPAWREAWRLLVGLGGWLIGTKLEEVMCRASGVERQTAGNLLRAARQANILEVRYRTIGGRRKAEYRVRRDFKG